MDTFRPILRAWFAAHTSFVEIRPQVEPYVGGLFLSDWRHPMVLWTMLHLWFGFVRNGRRDQTLKGGQSNTPARKAKTRCWVARQNLLMGNLHRSPEVPLKGT